MAHMDYGTTVTINGVALAVKDVVVEDNEGCCPVLLPRELTATVEVRCEIHWRPWPERFLRWLCRDWFAFLDMLAELARQADWRRRRYCERWYPN